ncbi:hypothetical protein PspLS_11396 [Pyricularia sp. CBS 133598]|nr:hypothetical protein PspLS_11396 [Pyricularia sp. CBS 133598]
MTARSWGEYLVDLHRRAIRDEIPEARASINPSRLAPPDPNDPYRLITFPTLDCNHPYSPYRMFIEYNDDWYQEADDGYSDITRFSDDVLGFQLPTRKAINAEVHSSDQRRFYPDNAIVHILADEEGIFMATRWMDKGMDLVRRNSSPDIQPDLTMPVNELLFQTFREVVERDGTPRTTNLKGIFVLGIDDEDFDVIATAHYGRNNLARREELPAKSWRVGLNGEWDGFLELLGTQVLAVMA